MWNPCVGKGRRRRKGRKEGRQGGVVGGERVGGRCRVKAGSRCAVVVAGVMCRCVGVWVKGRVVAGMGVEGTGKGWVGWGKAWWGWGEGM